MKYTGKNGKLRIYDGSQNVRAGLDVVIYDDSLLAYTDVSAEAAAIDASYTGDFWAALDDTIFVGANLPFAQIRFNAGAAAAFAADAGVLVPTYYNGAAWVAVPGFVDGTAVAGHTLAQNGTIRFPIPEDWAPGGDVNLTATKYYIQLAPTAVPSSAPDADLLAAVDGKYFEVAFANSDFSGPIGRGRPEEILVMNRGNTGALMHYIAGPDTPIMEPLDITFSAALDDTVNRIALDEALKCLDPNMSTWTGAGTTTKGTTANDGTNLNPAFQDASKKTVNIQMLWDNAVTARGWAYNEVYVSPAQITIQESEEGLTLSVTGACYGTIYRIPAFGNIY